MTQQVISDIHHYDQRLTAALANLENDKKVLDANRKKIKQLIEYRVQTNVAKPAEDYGIFYVRMKVSLTNLSN